MLVFIGVSTSRTVRAPGGIADMFLGACELCCGGLMAAGCDMERREMRLRQVAEERQRHNAPGRTPLVRSVE